MSTCQQPGCDAWGYPYDEPAGTWCAHHRPVLWKPTRSPWARVTCHKCGAPGAYPNAPRSKPSCRAHAPTWLRSYLKADAA